MKKYRLFNIAEIEKSLIEVKKNFNKINELLNVRREKLTNEIIKNIIDCYEFINMLLAKNCDILSPESIYYMLELNHIVLCGINSQKRAEYLTHIQATSERFFKNIEPILKWYKKEKKEEENPIKLAVGLYFNILSQPQLYIEGNHRTGNIILNYLLITYDKPPFILTVENALEYFNPSSKMKFSDKNDWMSNVAKIANFKKEFRKVIEKYMDERYVL